MKSFELEGVFWVPGEDNPNEVAGVLKYDVEAGIILKTIGQLFPSNERQFDFEIINGFVSNGKGVTIINSFRTNVDNFNPVKFEHYRCNYILLGEQYFKNKKELKFKKLKARFTYFDQWYNKTDSIDIESDRSNNTISVEYKLPEAISFELNNSLKIKFNTIATVPQKKHDGAYISQKTQIIFSNSRKKDLEYWIKSIFSFQEVITLFSQSCCYPIELYFSDIENNLEIKTDFIYQMSTSEFTARDIQHPRDFLVPFTLVKHKLPDFLKSWYLSQEQLDVCYIPYFNNFYYQNTYTTDKFLNISRASESFHRETTMLNMSYAKRLEELFSKCSRAFNGLLKVKNKKDFCSKLKDYRNDFTHSNSITISLKKKYLNTHYMTEKLTLILTCNLLKHHGLSISEIKSCIYSYPPYAKYRYKNTRT